MHTGDNQVDGLPAGIRNQGFPGVARKDGRLTATLPAQSGRLTLDELFLQAILKFLLHLAETLLAFLLFSFFLNG